MANILIVNKFYYPRGGDCTASLSLEKLLISKGHKVAVFASKHPLNIHSAWEEYFASEINFQSNQLKDKISAASRIFFSSEIKSRFTKLINDFQPDIIHVHNIHSYLSPYIVEIAAKKNIKVFWTLHDYKLLCPSYTCLREGAPCELCFQDKKNVILKKCMKNSLLASVLAYSEAKVWNKSRLEKHIQAFICPSFFMRSKMLAGGFRENKLHVLHNFIPQSLKTDNFEKEDYYCYVGRISPEKGLEGLLEVASQLPYTLKIVGGGNELEEYKSKYAHKNIEFLGQCSPEKALQIIHKARFSIIPSVWYENNPFSVIESLCMGTPVVGAKMGGIPELIEENINGFLFEANNITEIREKVVSAFETFTDSFEFEKVSEQANEKFSGDNFYINLMQIYNAK